MRFLERERATVEKLLPGLDESLQAVPLMELEGPSSPGIELFRDSGGPGLLVPTSDMGRGATALDALRVQRALGSRSPSLAVATTIHHFSMTTLIGLAANHGDGLERMAVEGVASDNRLVAFGFAEGRPGAGILSPSMTATQGPDGVRISGVTRPYGLARPMDLLIARVMVPRLDGRGEELAVVLVPAESEGLSVSGAGAGNEQVTLDDVQVPPEMLVRTADRDGQLDVLLTAGFAWYQLLMTGSYLGAAGALVERVLLNDRVPESERVRLLVETEGAMSAAEGLARRIDDDKLDESTLADSLYVRYCVQDILSRVVPRAVELPGDLNVMASEEVGHLAACANGLILHPPARSQMTSPLAAYLAHGPLTIA
ncbi:acyl-CoA dehydrogenase [Streptomyces ipomoeae]|uniref:acyl-CoA dehydrogenase n=1 Tax=Streptomyces ipomoeae TaxID=103232 RepID=UPI001147886A|nr:acyl-CoA dehydrogenase [Streptomyces ipomoeae]MDX2939025.1 acyl-CoA dehydrogenase [Streptomyces ipomoeae]TQE24297.1 acyl-CoA dehydrogenase [Streptomyces ipomoeae]